MSAGAVAFCATGRTGLGHLRRLANVATELARLAPGLPLALLANAPPDGLEPAARALLPWTPCAGRDALAATLADAGPRVVVVDTAVVPGLAALPAPLVLVLRECPDAAVGRFALDGGRPWDRVVVPNPAAHWLPPAGTPSARRLDAVGWIYRHRSAARPATPRPRLLVASGGGGNPDTAAAFRDRVAVLVAGVRQRLGAEVEVVQALGPRAPASSRLPDVDAAIQPGPDLDTLFAHADAVVSTAGYNSVLELACTDTPTVLVSIHRRHDDQSARARLWGPRLGRCLDGDDADGVTHWLATTLAARARRPRFELGPSGATRAAEIIAEVAGAGG
ncbi:MAG: hypothetical protein H6983_05970 [Ectothiorhodospiraceae bacterium]|nr:hypothetical protein [Chromatiales bacterium]MCP5153690.1 hypothetical protein [Ectothiorhodospiraceae bacterium]